MNNASCVEYSYWQCIKCSISNQLYKAFTITNLNSMNMEIRNKLIQPGVSLCYLL